MKKLSLILVTLAIAFFVATAAMPVATFAEGVDDEVVESHDDGGDESPSDDGGDSSPSDDGGSDDGGSDDDGGDPSPSDDGGGSTPSDDGGEHPDDDDDSSSGDGEWNPDPSWVPGYIPVEPTVVPTPDPAPSPQPTTPVVTETKKVSKKTTVAPTVVEEVEETPYEPPYFNPEKWIETEEVVEEAPIIEPKPAPTPAPERQKSVIPALTLVLGLLSLLAGLLFMLFGRSKYTVVKVYNKTSEKELKAFSSLKKALEYATELKERAADVRFDIRRAASSEEQKAAAGLEDGELITIFYQVVERLGGNHGSTPWATTKEVDIIDKFFGESDYDEEPAKESV